MLVRVLGFAAVVGYSLRDQSCQLRKLEEPGVLGVLVAGSSIEGVLRDGETSF